MSNPLKSVGKVFKKVLSKKVMKFVIAAAAIYTAGAAMGAWGAGAGASSGAGLAGGELGGLGVSGASGGATSGLAATTGAGAVEATTANLAAGAGGASTTAAAAPALSMGASNAAAGASLKGAATSMLNFIEAHPAATMIAGNMLQSAFTPTAAEQQAEIERNRRENSTFYGVGYHGQGPGADLGKLGFLASNIGEYRQKQQPSKPGFLSNNTPRA